MAPQSRPENRNMLNKIKRQHFWKNNAKLIQMAPKKKESENRFIKMEISNIPRTFDADQLKSFFGKYTVSNILINVNERGEPIGPGSVLMKTSQANKIIENGSQLEVNGIVINLKLAQNANSARRRLFSTIQARDPLQ